jgi:hypothetical protein
VEATATIFASNAIGYPLTAGITITQKIDIFILIQLLYYDLFMVLLLSVPICDALTNTSTQVQIVS